MCRYALNPYRELSPTFDDESTSAFVQTDITPLHRSIPEYAPTPLVELPQCAHRLGIKRLLVKDESRRFGLKAFKALGAAYAVYRFICEEGHRRGFPVPDSVSFYREQPGWLADQYTFCTATDGNHGRGVAWVARKLGQRAVIFMPGGSEAARVEAIESDGADVILVDGDYDAAVRASALAAADNGWHIMSDTAWPGYTTIPRWIAAGYLTMFREIEEELHDVPDVVFVQGGVGALASAAGWCYRHGKSPHRPTLISVESDAAACLLESIETPGGRPVTARGSGQTIMAGLNCATPSLVAWRIIRGTFDAFVSIGDDDCRAAMTLMREPSGGDPLIETGESGVAGLAALLAMNYKESLAELREHLNISSETTILVLNTEGDTAKTGRPVLESR